MPYVDAGLFEPRTVLGVDHLKGERKRRAMLPFGNVGAHKLRVEVERTFGRLRRLHADLGTWQRSSDALLRARDCTLARG
jgi:hypothetical protein